MPKVIVVAAIFVAWTPIGSAIAQAVNQSTVSHTLACENSLVCAQMKDGRSVAITDCKARTEGAVHYLYGDCQDED